MKSILLFPLMLLFFNLTAKEKSVFYYPVSAIDSSLKKDAHAVIRNYKHEFIIRNSAEATEKVKIVITVLEKAGNHFADFVLPYDKFAKVTSMTGRSYNMLGLPDEKMKSSQIQDLNYTSAGAIYDDLRLKSASFATESYPYTVEYDYEMEYSGLLGFPEWQPLPDYRIAVEKSSFTISFPDTMKVRCREFNVPDGLRKETLQEGRQSWSWSIENLPARKAEPYAPRLNSVTLLVITAPSFFTYDGHSGKMENWKNFGAFVGGLNTGRDQLSAERQKEIAGRVASLKDTAQIVRSLYEYMQGRTRYVAVQLGIGGYQPFPAETVDRLGYGDCKALSNYMKALLNAAGIPSVYTVAGTASSKGITMTDFPTFGQNNHAILSVPLQSDTIWLECTSQQMPCGFLGRSTAGRNVLYITPDGGKIIRTPLLSANQNQQLRKGELTIQSVGGITGNIETQYEGYQYDNISDMLTQSREEQEKALYDNYSVAGLKISNFGYSAQKDKIPMATETLSFNSLLYLTKTGPRIFVPLNPFNKVVRVPEKVDNRTMPVVLDYSYYDQDSLTYTIPVGYDVESLPKAKTISSPFGEYSFTVSQEGNKVVYCRRMRMERGEWDKEQYGALIDFYSAVVAADKIRLVLKEVK